MTNLWRKLSEDESGFLISSELVIVGTVGVLAMVVGLEAVSSAVIQELNDLSGAFGAISQSFNYRSIAKIGHARVSGAGFNDRGDFCDCAAITQTEVGGKIDGVGTASESFGSSAVISEQLVAPRVVAPAPVQETIISAPSLAPCVELPGEIIEEHIIRRRVGSFSDCATTIIVPQPETAVPTMKVPPAARPNIKIETFEPKPKRKN